MSSFLSRFLQALFPPKCLVCGRPAPEGLCPACRKQLPPEPLCRTLTLPDGNNLPVRCPLPYEGPYREALHRLKFQGRRALAQPLGTLMARAVSSGAAYDGVTYVPLSEKSRRARGYDQSRLLADRVGALLQLPVLELLSKVRETDVQHQLPGSQRMENVRGAYQAKNAAGLRLLLIDDIVTTGATLLTCAQTLYGAGAAAVDGLCAADTAGPERT